MPLPGFTISTDRVGPRRWVQVRIHPTLEHLYRAADRAAPTEGGEGVDWAGLGVSACFQPIGFSDVVDGWPTWPRNGYAGILRFAEGLVTPEIVAHEVVHAACWIYRMNVKADMRLGKGCGTHEEQLAYITGELSAGMAKHIRYDTP